MAAPVGSNLSGSSKPTRSDDYSVGNSQQDVVHQVNFEMGVDGRISKEATTFEVGPSESPTRVTVVAAVTGVQNRSATYTGTIQRRKMSNIAKSLKGLGDLGNSPRFELEADRIVISVQELLTDLAKEKSQGASREILRVLHLAMRNGGWAKFKHKPTASKVSKELERVSGLLNPTAQDVNIWIDTLDDLELQTLTILPEGFSE